MHLIIATRGAKLFVDEFIKQLQGKYLKTKLKFPKDKEPQDYNLQVLVRPVQIWDIGFAQEHLDLMLNTFECTNSNDPRYSKLEKFFKLLRAALKLKKIPDDYSKDKLMPICKQNMEIIPVGLKDDPVVDGIEQV